VGCGGLLHGIRGRIWWLRSWRYLVFFWRLVTVGSSDYDVRLRWRVAVTLSQEPRQRYGETVAFMIGK